MAIDRLLASVSPVGGRQHVQQVIRAPATSFGILTLSLKGLPETRIYSGKEERSSPPIMVAPSSQGLVDTKDVSLKSTGTHTYTDMRFLFNLEQEDLQNPKNFQGKENLSSERDF